MCSICFIVVVLISAVTPQTGGGTDGPSGRRTSVEPVPCNAPDRAIVTSSSTSQCGVYPTYVALHHKTKWLSGTFLRLSQIRLDSR
jgi:hypothetical protein